MRLTTDQVTTIKTTVTRVLGIPYRLWLFGSRVDDKKRGGDKVSSTLFNGKLCISFNTACSISILFMFFLRLIKSAIQQQRLFECLAV